MAEVELTDDLNENDIGSAAGMPIHVEWTPDHEGILVEWADKAMCYRWLHSKLTNTMQETTCGLQFQ